MILWSQIPNYLAILKYIYPTFSPPVHWELIQMTYIEFLFPDTVLLEYKREGHPHRVADVSVECHSSV